MSSSSNKGGGPVLDEATFQKLLAAAFVLQEHNDRLRPAADEGNSAAATDDSDSSRTLAEIVETQHQIQVGRLDLDSAMSLVVERIRKITGAQGAAIGLLSEDKVVYRAAGGTLARQQGTALRPEATFSWSTVLHDVILRCPDASTDFRVNPEITKRLGIGSLIAVPVFHDGKTAGALELVFSKPGALEEQDVRTCQLMAGLVTEALTHAAEEEWRKGVAAERASMLQVLEKIKPQLARLAQDSKTIPPPVETTSQAPAPDDTHCQHCGHELAPGEVFCGACGTSRSGALRNDLQSKWATLWNLKKADEQAALLDTSPSESGSLSRPTEAPAAPPKRELPDYILPEKPAAPQHSVALGNAPLEPVAERSVVETPPKKEEPALTMTEAVVPEIPVAPTDEKTPAQREWLQSIAVSPPAVQVKGFWDKHKGFLKRHPGDLALGAALILFVITIIWAISTNRSSTSADSGSQQASPNTANQAAPATTNPAAAAPKARRKAPPQPPQLGFFDQLLVTLGLAEAPAPPVDPGNPNIPVWEDIHTALYYCPGADLYGKTPQGRIASQRDAQLDQFEPASRKVCE